MQSYAGVSSRSPHDVMDGVAPQRGAVTDLDELLATLAEAPDLASSAAFLLSRLGELSGSSRGFVYLLDPAFEMLCSAAMVGFDDGDNVLPSSINDLSHPVVVSALSLHPIWSGAESVPDHRLPFARWV